MNFSDLTTLKIGGLIRDFVEAETEEQLVNNIGGAKVKNIPYLVIGGGSNLLVSDKGFDGTVIKNGTSGLHVFRKGEIVVKSGESLQKLVDFANQRGFAGLEKLAGIPGTVGGAIYGNAGAYGQTISDHLLSVKVFDPNNETSSEASVGTLKQLSNDQCQFKYRDSAFKRNKFIILEAIFSLNPGLPAQLVRESSVTIHKREVKYPRGIKCPGSFFKNIIASELDPELLSQIPEEKIVYGKVPAGSLLEMVGAKGDFLGQIKIAPYHANLFINEGSGTAEDFYILAKKYFEKVKEKFGIELEPEVQLINLPPF